MISCVYACVHVCLYSCVGYCVQAYHYEWVKTCLSVRGREDACGLLPAVVLISLSAPNHACKCTCLLACLRATVLSF
jgi:hypothetical protein